MGASRLLSSSSTAVSRRGRRRICLEASRLVGVCLITVWRTFAMAELDATMLASLELSLGTYLGSSSRKHGTTTDTKTTGQ